MQNIFKKSLLNYITKELEEETGNNIPQFDQEIETLNKNVSDDIQSELTNTSSITPLGRIYNDSYNAYLIYGYYTDTSSNNYGFIYLVDDELNKLQMITTFSSGTKLFPITALKQAEDGNIYGLSYTVGASTPTSRVLLFNNIFASGLKTGVYSAILRNDYIVPNNYAQVPYNQNRIIKSPDGAVYYLVFRDSSKTRFIKFTINVGSSNEWTTATLSGKFFISRFDMFLDKSGGDEVLHFYGVDSDDPSVYYEYEIKNTTVTQKHRITLEGSSIWADTQVFVKDINHIYLYCDYTSLGYCKIYQIVGNTLVTIKKIDLSLVDGSYKYAFGTLFELNGGTFFFEKHPTTTTNQYIARLTYIKENNEYYDYEVATYTGTNPFNNIYRYVDFYFSKVYNLCKIFVPIYSTQNSTIKMTFDFNEENYNGSGYIDIDVLKPVKATLHDEFDKMLFARNLYNKTINGGTTVSTLNIPTTNLNNVIIPQQLLWGRTNKILVAGIDAISKNIYENLYINFITTLQVFDEDDNKYYQNSASVINNNINNGDETTYEDKAITKVRINFEGREEEIIPINWAIIDDYNKKIEFSIYARENIETIDYISEDEETTYISKEVNLESGKIYVIKQKVRTGEKPNFEDLYYDNQPVNYNDEQLEVIVRT